ncbi:MAG: EamA family transporter [Cyanobacteria bacterium P01_G01_bin.38]
MGESERQVNSDDLLQSLDEDFQALQQHFAAQLSKDIEFLEAEKSRLIGELANLRQDYENLRVSYQALQADSEVALTEQQTTQQQAWAKQLSRVIARNLQEDLRSYVSRSAEQGLIIPHAANELLSNLDATLAQTLHSLQHDLSSYQSAIAQQITRMQAMEQQGEALLEHLVARLSQQLQAQPPALAINNSPLIEGEDTTGEVTLERGRPGRPELPLEPSRRLTPIYAGRTLPGRTLSSSSPKARLRGRDPDRPEQRQKGLLFSAIATLLLALSTLLVGVISQGNTRFGPAFEAIGTFSFLQATALVWLRMGVLLPVLLLLAPQLHRGVWTDFQQWGRSGRLWLQLIGSGFFLFCSQVFLYQAVSTIGPGLATALLFVYPLVGIPLMWSVNRERPNLMRWVVMGAITMGGILAVRPALIGTDTLNNMGIGAALLAAIAFALYIVTMNLNLARQCHPVSSGIVHFCTTALISSLILMAKPFALISSINNLAPFVLGGLGLGILASLAYFFNFIGLRLAGGHRAAIIAASTPFLTAVLAGLLLTSTTFALIQWAGLALITLAGVALSLDRLGKQT